MPLAPRLPAITFAAFLLAAASLPAAAETFVFSHLLESSGGIIDTQNSFDTQIFMTYTAGLAGTDPGAGATVDLYLYDEQTGQPLTSATALDVCNPCSFPLADETIAPRKRKINIGDLLQAQGGFASPVVTGFVVAVVSGDAENVSITSAIVNAKTGPQDLSVFVFEPQPIAAAAALPVGGAGGPLYVAPEVLETPGIAPYQFDSEIFLTYSGGLAGIPGGGGADVDLYLFDQTTGLPMMGGGGTSVCNPCTFSMGTGGAVSPSPRKRSIVIESLINAAGGFGGASVLEGFAMIVARGADPGAVGLATIVVNGRSGPADLSVFVFEPQPIAVAAPVAVESDVTGDVSSLRTYPNPAAGGSRFDFTLARASDVAIEIYDAQGRRVASMPLGMRAAGDHTVHWDGRDDAGLAVPAGTYFGRLGAGDGSRVNRLVMLSP